MKLKNRTVIVTGAGSGIGRALAREFGRNQARVVCCGRRKNKIEETKALIEQEGGIALALATDINRYDQVQSMVQMVLDRFSTIDICTSSARMRQICL